MAAQPTVWDDATQPDTGWYSDTPQFSQYNTDRPYNDDVPYNHGVAVSKTDWDALTKIAGQWSDA